MVDHHFANASRGAIGLISTSVKPERKDLEHRNLEASAAPTDPETVRAKLNFESTCLACHTVGEGKKLRPDLAGVTRRRTDAWLTRWLKEPEKMLESDADARVLLSEHNNIPMPNQSLGPDEIEGYVKYFHWIDSRRPGAAKAAMSGH